MNIKFKLIMSLIIGVLFSFSLSFSASNSLTCEFKTTCQTGEVNAGFYVNKNSVSTTGEVLNSVLSIITDANYNKKLCCSSTYPQADLKFNLVSNSLAGSVCGSSQILFYLENNTNSIVSLLYNSTYSSYVLCGSSSKGNLNMPIVNNPTDYNRYTNIGYSCLFKISSDKNGKVSSCNATFNGGNQYPISVLGRLWENSDSLKCNADCTSKFDGRIYTSCASKISSCAVLKTDPTLANLSNNCDGALLGSWVEFNSTSEGKCQAPWNEVRDKIFTSKTLDVSSKDNQCLNLINKKYQVIVDNELVTMNIYICSD